MSTEDDRVRNPCAPCWEQIEREKRMQAERAAAPVRRAVLVTPDDVVVMDAAIALLRVAGVMSERLPQLVALRERMAGSVGRA